MDFKKEKVVIYIDGSNMYFSVRNAFNCKVDLEKFCYKLAKDYELAKINYYIAPLNQVENPGAYAEQQSFLKKIRKIDKLNIIFGRLEKIRRDGEIHYVEKATDVNLALDLVLDAQKGIYDKALLISNDGDFSGAVSAAVGFNRKVVYIAIGTNKSISYHLKKVASEIFRINKEFIDECILE